MRRVCDIASSNAAGQAACQRPVTAVVCVPYAEGVECPPSLSRSNAPRASAGALRGAWGSGDSPFASVTP